MKSISKIRWSPTAISHFSSWIFYIVRDSKLTAERERKNILKSIRRLARFPQSGRIVPEFSTPTLREIIHGPIRILYRIKEKQIHLLAFHHSSRPLDSELFF